MKKIIFIIALFTSYVNLIQAQSFKETIKLSSSDPGNFDFFGFDVSINNNQVLVGVPSDNEDEFGENSLPGAGAGAAYIFQFDSINGWRQSQKLVSLDRGPSESFGLSVALSKNYAIISATNEDENALGQDSLNGAGAVYIFEQDSMGMWTPKQKLVPSDRGKGDQFGVSVSIFGNHAVIGAYLADVDTLIDAGAVYIFEINSDGDWVETQKLVAPKIDKDDRFGREVALFDSLIIVGACLEDEDNLEANRAENTGSAYIYKLNSTGNWNLAQKIVASDRTANDQFGLSVDISQNYAFVGAIFEDEDSNNRNTLESAGAVYVFQRNQDDQWIQTQKLVACDRALGDNFGLSISIQNDFAAIGSWLDDEDALGMNPIDSAGSVYLFQKNPVGKWVQVQKLVSADRGVGDIFGSFVDLSDDHIIIGAPFADFDTIGGTIPFAGSAYIFEKSEIVPCSAASPDSIYLVAIYNSTDGPNWTVPWDLNQPVANWPGVSLNGNCRVDTLDLGRNNLTGVISDTLTFLSDLKMLDLSENNLTSIPQLDSLCQLTDLFINDNEIRILPFINHNILSQFTCQDNQLNFQQLEPFVKLVSDSSVNFIYSPQDSIGPFQNISTYVDSILILDASDGKATGNEYQWYENGIPLVGETNVSLSLTNLMAFDTLTYHTEIDNSAFPELTLIRRDIQVFVFDTAATPPARPEDPNPHRFVFDYSDKADSAFRSKVEDQLKLWGAFKVDSCICNNLEVWSVPDTLEDVLDRGPIRQHIGNEESLSHARRRIGARDTLTIDWDYITDDVRFPEGGTQWKIDFVLDSSFSPSDPILVGIPDFGVDNTHPFIGPFIWENPDPIIGKDTCFLNDNNGWNFANDSNNPFQDTIAHGTHIASTIVNLIPGTPIQIMSLQVGGSSGQARVFEVACALRYAIIQEAQIINLSMGYQGPASEMLTNIMKDTEVAGILMVISAGNDSSNNDVVPHWPSNLPFENIIVVAAYDPNSNDLANFSNYGLETVDIAAPGLNIYSALPNNGFGPKSGTSIAASFITAVGSRLLSEDPSLKPNEIIEKILSDEESISRVDTSLLGKIKDGRRLNVSFQDCGVIPIVVDDSLVVKSGSSVTFDVRVNDCHDPSVLPQILAGSMPQNGIIIQDPVSGSFTYTPNPGFTGVDTLQYELCSRDGRSTCSTATVFVIVGTTNIQQQINDPFALKVFPNPSTDQVSFSFSINTVQTLQLEIFNRLGQKVGIVLPPKHFLPGNYLIDWEVSSLNPGLYYYRLSGSRNESSGLIQVNK